MRRDAPVASHGAVPARTKVLFHSAAWRAVAGSKKNRVADFELFFFQGLEIDARNDNVASYQARVDGRDFQNRSYRNQMLVLNERDLPLGFFTSRETIARQSVQRGVNFGQILPSRL